MTAVERRRATVGSIGLAVVAAALGGCTPASHRATPTTLPPTTTTEPPDTAPPPPPTSPTVSGVGPIPQQPPFYPAITVTSVVCGSAPGGARYVRADLPAGQPGTPSRSVLAQPTYVLI